MKKSLIILTVLSLVLIMFSGCSGSSELPAESGESQRAVAEFAEDPPTAESPGEPGRDSDYIDLTAMSATMVFAEVFNMMQTPENYVGKTVKLSGPYMPSYYDETGSYYHYVVVEDALACCSQGLEFKLPEDQVYPGDYPEESALIEITGTYKSYDELDITYYYIEAEEFAVV